jgi:3-deoxy-7-phosphoheptulonate synthase
MAELYTSHEALLLGYEQALTRKDSISGDWYDCSAHFLWIGNRTRQIDGAHVEFLSGVKNPIGIKAGPSLTPGELMELAQKLNPENEFGRLTIITRMGADKINDYLPPLIKRAKSEKLNLLWICDPMHGNTYKTENGFKTRHFNTILKEIQRFFAIHKRMDTIPGGVHFELTGDNVTECVGGAQKISDNDLKERYESACDPRLNNEQSLELAFLITELLRKKNA